MLSPLQLLREVIRSLYVFFTRKLGILAEQTALWHRYAAYRMQIGVAAVVMDIVSPVVHASHVFIGGLAVPHQVEVVRTQGLDGQQCQEGKNGRE